MRIAETAFRPTKRIAIAVLISLALILAAIALFLNRAQFTPTRDPAAPVATPPPMKLLPPQRMVAPPEKNVLVVPEPELILEPRWTERPTGKDFERYYPPAALDKEQKGQATLDCLVLRTGRLDCIVVEEAPKGLGFGAAALRIANAFQIAPQTEDGRPTSGRRVRLPIVFNFGR